MNKKICIALLCLSFIIGACSNNDDTPPEVGTENPEVVPEPTVPPEPTPTPDPTPIPTDPEDVGFDWEGIAIPAQPGDGKFWKLSKEVSDDFKYSFPSSSTKNTLFGGKWTNFYHNNWEGPDPTRWIPENVSVANSSLQVKANRVAGETKGNCDGNATPLKTTRSGCVTSSTKVLYPIFIEARVKIPNSVMACAVWLLSPDDTQEIDILEAYGSSGSDNRSPFFAERVHLSHHVFVRKPFQDYQPKDEGTWHKENGVTEWGGKWINIGVYWRDPKHLEYYIDGEHVRTVSDKAFATKINGTWEYTYPAPPENGKLPNASNGFQRVISASSLEEANAISTTSVIDPFNYLGNGMNMDKESDIIINMEDQTWRACVGDTPTDAEIQNQEDHTMLVDWIRAYKPTDI